MSDYLITRWVAGSSEEIGIHARRFEQTRIAKAGVLLSIELEERVGLVLESYREFETELYSHGVRWAMHEDWRWEARQDQVFELNRRILNLVNAVLMYRDHVNGEVERSLCISRPIRRAVADRIKAAFSSRALLAVRLLRNYCQHQSLGFRGVGVKNSRYRIQRQVPKGPFENKLFTTAVLAVDASKITIRNNRDPAKAVLDELQARSGETWDPAPELRQAIDEITRAHSDLRESLSQSLRRWRNDLEWVLQTARENFSTLIGLCVVERYERGRYDEPIEVFPEMIERVEKLQRRNGGPTNLQDRIVTAAELLPGA